MNHRLKIISRSNKTLKTQVAPVPEAGDGGELPQPIPIETVVISPKSFRKVSIPESIVASRRVMVRVVAFKGEYSMITGNEWKDNNFKYWVNDVVSEKAGEYYVYAPFNG